MFAKSTSGSHFFDGEDSRQNNGLPFKVPVEVLHVDAKEEKVVCRLIADADCYEELRLKMNNFYSNQALRKPAREVRENGFYAVEMGDNWYRAQLKWMHFADQRCCIWLVDIGRKAMFPFSALFVLDKWFIIEPFHRCYSVEFATPRKNLPLLVQAGFCNCADIQEGDRLEAYVLSVTDVVVTLFKQGDVFQEPVFTESFSALRSLSAKRFEERENYFSQSLASSTSEASGFHRSQMFSSSFSKPSFSDVQQRSTRNTLQPDFSALRDSTKMDGPFRVPNLPNRVVRRGKTRNDFSFSEAKCVERDYLNRTLTSIDSESDIEPFKKSIVHRKGLKTQLLPASPLSNQNSDSYSDVDSATSQFNGQIEVKVLNANNACEIYVETAETRKRTRELKCLLRNVDMSFLRRVSTSWMLPNENLLHVSGDGGRQRVRVLTNDNEGISVICIDTGEEIFAEENEQSFFSLPPELHPNILKPACLGPLRLAGNYSANWMTVSSGIRLRELCETAVSARLDQTEGGHWITLFDAHGRNINQLFDNYTKTSPAARRKESKGR